MKSIIYRLYKNSANEKSLSNLIAIGKINYSEQYNTIKTLSTLIMPTINMNLVISLVITYPTIYLISYYSWTE